MFEPSRCARSSEIGRRRHSVGEGMNLRWTKSLIYCANQALAGRAGCGRRLRVCRYSVGGGWLGRLGAVAASSSLGAGGWGALLFVCATAGPYATAGLAQDANYTSANATPDTPVQCSAAPLPTIRARQVRGDEREWRSRDLRRDDYGHGCIAWTKPAGRGAGARRYEGCGIRARRAGRSRGQPREQH